MTDLVNHPQHYEHASTTVSLDLSPIEVCKYLDFCRGNAFKYIIRYKHKNGLEDLKKAEYYINRMPYYKSTNNLEYQLTEIYLSNLLKENKITEEEFNTLTALFIDKKLALRYLNNLIKNVSSNSDTNLQMAKDIEECLIDDNTLSFFKLIKLVIINSKKETRNTLQICLSSIANEDSLSYVYANKIKDILLSFLDRYRSNNEIVINIFNTIKDKDVESLCNIIRNKAGKLND